jgi:hypothetical protein
MHAISRGFERARDRSDEAVVADLALLLEAQGAATRSNPATGVGSAR